MVGLVLVSHSRKLAEALQQLLGQLSAGKLPVAVAAGAGEDHQETGTDPFEIASAIQTVYSEEGVVVFMDMGSALLSAEMALEFLPEEQRARVRLCPGALVEGSIAAAALASAGADLDQVFSEASQALEPKFQHLGGGQMELAAVGLDISEKPTDRQISIALSLQNEHGLHARPAARFVQAAAAFEADIQVTNLRNGKGPVSARSLNALATLEALSGDEILITASGPEAEQALAALRDLVENQFNLSAIPPEEAATRIPEKFVSERTAGGSLHGIPLSEGIALGPLVFPRFQQPETAARIADEPEQEWQRLQEAIQRTRAQIERQRLETLARSGELQAEIFAAHQLILDDPGLQSETKERIFERGQPAELAWQDSINQAVEAYQTLADPYLKARSSDVRAVGNQVLAALRGDDTSSSFPVDEPGILFLDTITPAQVVQLDPDKTLGLVLATGGPTSHSAILTRALGFPAIGGIDLESLGIAPSRLAALDGSTGELWLEPGPQLQEEINKRRRAWLERKESLLQASRKPAVTMDGRRIEVAANAGSVAEARAAGVNGAEGIGVLRTEFLYLAREAPPEEAEQLDVLNQICAAIGGGKVIVRTLDIGGDKYLPYIQSPREANPYLGVRGLRLSMQLPELFRVQLRAILRAGASNPVSVMFPMVTNHAEVVWAKEQLLAAHESLVREGLAHCWPVETGIMVEVPSAALAAEALAPLVDFFSIGTNDLTQYTLAAERGNPGVAGLGDALHPAVLRLIRLVVEAAHRQGKWSGVCGEIAADPLAIPILVGLGVDELSMNPAAIPLVKSAIRRIDLRQAGDWAQKALTCSEAEQVRSILQISP